MISIQSIPNVADVHIIAGEQPDASVAPALLVEVPHGADRHLHYEALRRRLRGPLPDRLERFFFANTDVGAWQYGCRVAELFVAERPDKRALVVRCLVPRTFIDTNRLVDAADELGKGGLTPGMAPYITDADDRALLADMHAIYTDLATRAFAHVCGNGGIGLIPHTYGPRTMGIDAVDKRIVERLEQAAKPGVWQSWPLRAEVDLLTRDGDGVRHVPDGLVDALIDGFAAVDVTAVECGTFNLHPATQGFRHTVAWPGRVLCMEVRRDLLVERFSLFEELSVDAAAVERIAAPIAAVLPLLGADD